jgi:hypothetical protein
MDSYIAYTICCTSFTSIRLLVINELWIDGYNKPILINVIKVPIHTFKHSQLQWTGAVYKQINLPVVFNYLLLILVCKCFFILVYEWTLSDIYESPEGSFEIQDSKFEIQYLKFEIRDSKFNYTQNIFKTCKN